MTIIVEDGTGKADAQSYVSVAQADTYHSARGNAAWTGANSAKEAALVRATAYLDATYRGRFPGYPRNGRVQALEWPRQGAYVIVPDNGRSEAFLDAVGPSYGYLNGVYAIAANEIPREIVAATCEAALRELVGQGSLAPDLERGGAIKRLKAGSVEVEYTAGAVAATAFQSIDLALASLLSAASPFSGRAARG